MACMQETARRGDPDACAESVTCVTRQVEGLRSEATIRGYTVVIDEPEEFGGTGAAPNPAELALAALGACLEVTIRAFAAHLSISVDAVGVELRSKLDTRGFMGVGQNVRSGFDRIDVIIKLETSASDKDLEMLVDAVERGCPVLDALRNPTPVDIGVERQGCEPSEVIAR